MANTQRQWKDGLPIEQVKNIARFIAYEYYKLSYRKCPSDIKLNAMVYFCVRDAFYVIGKPIIEETFEIYQGNQIRTVPGLPNAQILVKEPTPLADPILEHIIKSVLPNYARQATWVLQHDITRVLTRQIKAPTAKTILPITTDILWEEALRHQPYDYYEEEPFGFLDE